MLNTHGKRYTVKILDLDGSVFYWGVNCKLRKKSRKWRKFEIIYKKKVQSCQKIKIYCKNVFKNLIFENMTIDFHKMTIKSEK